MGIEARAKRWDQDAVDKLKHERDNSLKELTELSQSLTVRVVEQTEQLNSEIVNLTTQIRHFKSDLETTHRKIAEKDK